MKKILKKWGANLAVLFTKDEEKIHGLYEGKIYDVEISRKRRRK